jgi:hypothetical protein
MAGVDLRGRGHRVPAIVSTASDRDGLSRCVTRKRDQPSTRDPRTRNVTTEVVVVIMA